MEKIQSPFTSIKDDPENIFILYKKREEVEQAFDAMKNELENDKSYLQDTMALRGYFFISFLSLYIYFSILQMLKSHDLHPKMSVKEALLELSKIYAISTGGKEITIRNTCEVCQTGRDTRYKVIP